MLSMRGAPPLVLPDADRAELEVMAAPTSLSYRFGPLGEGVVVDGCGGGGTVDVVPEDFKRRAFRQDLSRSAPAGDTALPPGFLHAHTTNGGFPQSPRTVPALR